ncbi:hypothetical protein J3R83DRAFT_219 [Lanmaoa asiatica]|nr:hypothetical protein J3R83DRAFT_219 [Lanmaoa asiatica]
MSITPSPLSPSLIINPSFGAFLIGVVVSATLYGVTCIQTWYYYSRYPSDPWYIKLLVAAVLVSDSCHQALITHTGKYNHPQPPLYIYGFRWVPGVSSMNDIDTDVTTQSIVSRRMFRFIFSFSTFCSRTLSLPLQTFAQLADLKVMRKKNYSPRNSPLMIRQDLSMSINAVAAAGDVLIAVFLCTLLQRSRTGFRRSDTMINKLVSVHVDGAFFSERRVRSRSCSIAAWPATFIYIAFYFCLGRLYCNSLLATLNARKGLRGESRSDEMSLSLQGVAQKTNNSIVGTTSGRVPNNISIKIDTTQEYVRDEVSNSSGLSA